MPAGAEHVNAVADSRDGKDYRRRVKESESVSVWQSLSFGPNYKAAYCMAVCPAGEDVIGPYLTDRKAHQQEVVKPLQDKPEPVYVIKGSDADLYASKKWKNKTVKYVGNALHPRTIDGLLATMPLVFQPAQSRGLNATYHFTFTGDERREATVVIHDRTFTADGSLFYPSTGQGNLPNPTHLPEFFGDFVLDLEFKTEGNSGVFIRTGNPRDNVQTGIEIQIYKPMKPSRHSTGAVYDAQAPTKDLVKLGQWNRMVITAKGSIFVNGVEFETNKSTEPAGRFNRRASPILCVSRNLSSFVAVISSTSKPACPAIRISVARSLVIVVAPLNPSCIRTSFF